MSKALAIFQEQPLPEILAVPVTDLLAEQMGTRAGKTRKAYGSDLASFAKFVGMDVDEAIRKLIGSSAAVANGVVLAFQRALHERGLHPSTVNRRMAALRAVMKLARTIGSTTVELGLVSTLKSHARSRDVRGPGIEIVRKLLAVCDADPSLAGRRDAAILRWLMLVGLRRNELRLLTMRDCTLACDEPFILVEQKGHEGHKVPIFLERPVAHAIDPWLLARGEAPGALFGSLSRRARQHSTLEASGLNKIMLRRAVQAGYPGAAMGDGRKITPHSIRHTAISEVAREKGLLAAQLFARHMSSQTTMVYLDETSQIRMSAQGWLAQIL